MSAAVAPVLASGRGAAATPTASSSSDAAPHHAVSFAASTPSGAVQPSPGVSSNGSPLQLPAHPTTPSSGSSDAALEAAAGINVRKISTADVLFGRALGEGAFAKVVACTLRTDSTTTMGGGTKQYAVKIVDKAFVTKMGKIHTVLNEKRILTLLHDHVGIVKLAFTFQDNVSLYYMMELAEGGELFSDLRSVGKYSLDLARFYAAQLVEILAFMHAPGRRVLHRDLKPENVLLTADRHIRLTDFGTARQLTPADEATNDDADGAGGPASAGGRGSQHKKSRRGSFVGTAEYVSPEVLRDEMPGPSADLWSLGCILFQMLTGRVPFRGASEYLTFQKILKRRLHFPEELDPSARDLIERLLVVDPSKRLGAGGTPAAYAELRAHPFFAASAGQLWGDELFRAPVPPKPAPSAVLAEPIGASEEPNSPEPMDDDDDEDDEEDDEDREQRQRGNSEDEWASRMAALGVDGPAGVVAAPASAALGDAARLGGGEADESGDGLAPLPSSSSAAAASAPPAAAVSSSSSSSASFSSSSTSPSSSAAAVPHGPTVAEKIASTGGSGASASVHAPLSSRGVVHHAAPLQHHMSMRLSTDGQYANSVWSKFLKPASGSGAHAVPAERILYAGLVMKRRSIFARKRQLLLTSLPRLFYVDPEKMELKKEIAWSDALWAEVADPVTFWIHTPKRDYYMRGLSASSYAWCNEINGLQLQLKAARGDAAGQHRQ